MLLPLFGFVLSCVMFSATAALLTVLITIFVGEMELSGRNVLLFLVGAFPGQLLGMIVYGYLIRGHVQSQTAYPFLLAVYVGGVVGGLTAWLLRSLLKRESPSHH